MPRLELRVADAAQQERLDRALGSGALVVDTGRRRPFWFDGRFLTAADLLAEQNYVRARQSDLAAAIGSGVVHGLEVRVEPGATAAAPEVVVSPGVGVTPAGDLVSVEEEARLRLDTLPDQAALDASLGLKLLSTAAANNRTGLFVLALRPIEFSANPVAAYPTTLDGARDVHDGDIVEATAVTLIPYPDRAGVETPDDKRARVAREIFLDGTGAGAPQEALPLALLCVEGGTLRWLDPWLVRREVGAESTLAAGLRQRPRALVEAFVRQHLDQMAALDPAVRAAGFPAARHFRALPPAGRCPAAALRFDNLLGEPVLLQSFLPPTVEVEFAFVPDDEVAALVEEALALPPLDLQDSDEIDRLSVLIAAPVARAELMEHQRTLDTLTRPVRSAAPGMVAKRLPLESLLRLTRPEIRAPAPADAARAQAVADAWARALAAAQGRAQARDGGLFWYFRRRLTPRAAVPTGATLRLAGTAAAVDAEVDARLAADAATDRFAALAGRMPRLAVAEAASLLAAPRLAVSPTLAEGRLRSSDILRRSALAALEGAGEGDRPIEHADVLRVARRFGAPELGQGLDALAAAAPGLGEGAAADTIAASGAAPDLDAAARALPPAALPDFAGRLAGAAGAGDVEAVRALAKPVEPGP